MSNKQKSAFLCPIIIGALLIAVGLSVQMPGGALTTYGSLNGELTDSSYYKFDNRYSSIDEYVGGDAYNYIIGASLVAGKMSGTMTVKAICIVGGTLCICFGITLMMLMQKEPHTKEHIQSLPDTLPQFHTEDSESEQEKVVQ